MSFLQKLACSTRKNALLICCISIGWLILAFCWVLAPSLMDATASRFSEDAVAVSNAKGAWGDWDGDDDLDLIIQGLDTAGIATTQLYFNQNGTLIRDSLASASLIQVAGGDVAWGDYDNDGEVDLLLSGSNADGVFTKLYRNDAAAFIDLNLTLTNVEDSDLEWVDIDNDGFLDIVIVGNTGASRVSEVYLNRFKTDLQQPFVSTDLIDFPLDQGAQGWNDFDQDGDQDGLITGMGEDGTPQLQLFINQRNGILNARVDTNFIPVSRASIAWGEYDNDGWTDVVVSGITVQNRPLTMVYRNNQGNSFTPILVDSVGGGSIVWSDWDDDGDSDLLVVGDTLPAGSATRLYTNEEGVWQLQQDDTDVLANVGNGAFALWGDVDKNGLPDVVLGGVLAGGEKVLNLYENLFENPTSKPRFPPSPQNLQARQIGDRLILSWDPPAEAIYPAGLRDGLSYNVYVGSVEGQQDIFSAQSNLLTGFNRLVTKGNVGQINEVIVEDLSADTYFWGVQSIDADFESSAFANGNTFSFQNPSWEDVTTDFITDTIGQISESEISWIDYDRDEDLDVLIIGASANQPFTRLYNNDEGMLSPVNSGLPNMRQADVAWQDINGDGFPDVILMGRLNGNPSTRIYLNVNGETFVNSGVNLEGAFAGDVVWLDYDNDGDQDFLYSGSNSTIRLIRLYQNNGGEFTNVNSQFTAIDNGSLSVVDFDNDSYVDVFVTGASAGGPFSQLYRNVGGKRFEATADPFIALSNSTSNWLDVDNDGDSDVIVSGFDGINIVTRLYRNDRITRNFSVIATPIVGVRNGSIVDGDLNLDGKRDLIITGDSPEGAVTRIYLQEETGNTFTVDEIGSGVLEQLNGNGGIALGDFDNNATLDVMLAGSALTGPTFQLAQNITSPDENIVPAAPTALNSSQNGDTLTLQWAAPVSVVDQVGGYTYEVWLSRAEDTTDLKSPLAILASGKRLTPKDGSSGNALSLTTTELTPGTYLWSVQSVDQDYEGSTFAPIDTFEYANPLFVENIDSVFAVAPPNLAGAALDWGDYNNDDQLDLIIAGNSETGKFTRLYQYDNGQLVNSGINNIAGVSDASLDWGDYNLDGRLDLLLTGANNQGPVSRIYRNDGNQNFTVVSTPVGISHGDAMWLDVDRDGDLDIVLSGEQQDQTPVAAVLINNGADSFIDTEYNITPVTDSKGDWADYNGDGLMDMIWVGTDVAGNPSTTIYQNTDTGFVNAQIDLVQVTEGQATFVDYNNDGLPDIFITGNTLTEPVSALYRNVDGTTFDEVALDIPGVRDAATAWGDFDNDGSRDLILSGINADGNTIIQAYTNSDPNTLTLDNEASRGLTPVSGGEITWVDVDQDGSLDLSVVGTTANGLSFTGLYNNRSEVPSLVPGQPTGLEAEQVGNSIIFSWDMPEILGDNIATGFSYNIYINQGDSTLFSPQANLNNGFRKVLGEGNVSHNRRWELKNPSEGTYSWGVQAIDADYEGSAFAQGEDITYQEPEFELVTSEVLDDIPNYTSGKLDWGDVNNDNLLDLLVIGEMAGSPETRLYIQNTDNELELAGDTVIADLSEGAFDWTDFDNDGFLDLVLAGDGISGPVTAIYRNGGNGQFTQVETEIAQLASGDVEWGDYDNDGYYDLVITGQNASQQRTTRLYRNDHNDNWVAVDNANITGITDGSVAWGDYDNDRDLDLLITGESDGGRITEIFENRGDGSFTEVLAVVNSTSDLPGISNGNASWGDYNNDGFLDILLVGTGNTGPIASVYLNTNGIFSIATQVSLAPLTNGVGRWGDYNDDGYIDIILAGNQNGQRIATLYENTQNGSFRVDQLNSESFLGVGGNGDVIWGDYDFDGKLDLAFLGANDPGLNEGIQLYRNIEATVNTVPLAPTNLSSNQESDLIEISWNAPSNIPVALRSGLSYNLYVGTEPGEIDTQSPLASLENGKRQLVKYGPINGTTWNLKNLSAGTYFWSVQAIDQDFEGSEFAEESSFIFAPPDFTDETNTIFAQIPQGLSEAKLAWVDYNGDDMLDLFALGNNLTQSSTRLYKNVGANLEVVAGTDIINVTDGDADWADYDNNGFPDLALCGRSDTGAVTLIYRNQESQIIRRVQTLKGLSQGSVAWGDYDNDGFPDLLVTGADAQGTAQTILYHNNGGLNLSEVSDISDSFTDVRNGNATWGDYNNDGRLDIALTGDTDTDNVTHLYKNMGDSTFVLVNAALSTVRNGHLAWGDANNDGRLDLLLTGDAEGNPISIIHINEGNDRFSIGDQLTGIEQGEGAWGDFNDDGYADIVLTGLSRSGGVTELFRNQQGNGFIRDSLNSEALRDVVDGSSIAWGDYDNDGKLDLALAGGNPNGGAKNLIIYRNTESRGNRRVSPPRNLLATSSGNQITFKWSPPNNIDSQLVGGLSYSIYIGTNRRSGGTRGPNSNTLTGYRRIIERGAIQDTFFSISNLEAGTYYWSVQTIDVDFEGSEFAPEQELEFSLPVYDPVTILGDTLMGVELAALSWGDYDNDGDLDLLTTGRSANGNLTTIYANLGEDSLVQTEFFLDRVRDGSVAWADYNKDGFLDILLCGETSRNLVTRIYKSDSARSFNRIGASLPGIKASSVDWGDADNDGDLDIALCGLTMVEDQLIPISQIYINAGNDQFNKLNDIDISDVQGGIIKWVDYDRDGLMDLFLAGESPEGPVSELYRNRGNRNFELVETPFTQVGQATGSWGDFNNDGYADLLLAGEQSDGTLVTELYQNNEGDSFVSIDTLIGIKNGEIVWGDYNEDNFIDALITGESDTEPLVGNALTERGLTALYRNVNGRGLQLDSINTPVFADLVNGPSVAWSDYDRDGKLDIVIGGFNEETQSRNLILYRNIGDQPADPAPLAPIPGEAVIGEDRISFSWETPNQNGAEGYTYNIRVGTTLDGEELVSAMSNLQSGQRKVLQRGNVGSVNEWTLTNLSSNTYYWSVQSIDQEYQASSFSVAEPITFNAAKFIDLSALSLPDNLLGLTDGDIELGDYDNDGDLDLLVSGVTDSGSVTRLYENVRQSEFVETDIELTGFARSSMAWGDFNNDGWLDFFITGFDGTTTRSQLYINSEENGERVFEATNFQFGTQNGHVTWGDYNNDGYQDLLISGANNNNSSFIRVYENNRMGGFTRFPIGLGAGSENSYSKWGDYDNDGDLDILISGSADNVEITVVFENRFNEGVSLQNSFRRLGSSEDSLVQVANGSVDWGDVDNDGDLDILVAGEDADNNLHTKIYENLGEGNFSELFVLDGIANGEARWVDFNEDGFLDVILTGRNGTDADDRTTALYLYNSITSSYQPDNAANVLLEDLNGGSSLAFGDYDRDGLLDIFVTGQADGPDINRVFKLYQNRFSVAPVAPEPPINLTAAGLNSDINNTFEINLSWTPADSLRTTLGYSYNLIFTAAGNNEAIYSPLADTLEGFRRVVELGNMSQNKSWTIRGLPEGSYRWTVQAVDQSLQGSDFAEWASLTLAPPTFEDITNDIFDEPPISLSNGSISLGDIGLNEGDEDLDFVITGEDDEGVPHSLLYEFSRTNGVYQLSTFSDRLIGVKRSSSGWADYDMDGDLDLLICGEDTSGNPSTRIYENRGNGNMIVDTIASNSLPQLWDASIAWGDYNNDGFADILMTGSTGAGFSGKVTALYTNDRDRSFSRLVRPFGVESSEDFEPVDRGAVAWGDYDRDGDLDFIITGSNNEGTPFTTIYRNRFLEGEVENRFTGIDLPNADVLDSDVTWGDINNDGYLDIVLSGFGGPTIGNITAVFEYLPEQDRFNPSTLPVPRVRNGDIALGDYDLDGYKDLLITGQTQDSTLVSQIASNERQVNFEQDLRSSDKIPEITSSSSLWGDLGVADGKLDIIISGRQADGTNVLKILRNERIETNSAPPPPINLDGVDTGLFVRLSWDLPQDYDSALVNGLSYNLIVIRKRDTSFQVSPLADTVRGVRRVVGLGNAGQHTSWNLTQIPTGCYEWGIQSVDADLEGGEFAFAENEVCFTASLPSITDSSIVEYFPWGGDTVTSWIQVEDTSLVREVRVCYSPISSTDERCIVLQPDSNQYNFDIHDNLPLMDPQGRMLGIDYFFEVRGRFATNQVRTTRKYTYIQFPEFVSDMDLVDNDLIRYGIDQTSYNVLSIPLELENKGIQLVLDELGPYNDTQWRMFSTIEDEYREFNEDGGDFTDFELGKSYWLIIRSAEVADQIFPGAGTTVRVTEETPYILQLQPGWNQIGNPYNYNIMWGDVLALNPGAIDQIEELRTFNFTLNPDASVLERFSGGFVMAHSEVGLRIPVRKNLQAQRLGNYTSSVRQITNPLDFATWRVDLQVEGGTQQYSYATIGMDRNASVSRDHFDRMRMPRFTSGEITYMDITFEHPEYFYPYFAKDIVPSQQNYIWDFVLASNTGEKVLKLSWDNSYFGQGQRQLILFDKEKQRWVDMRNIDQYTSVSNQIDRPFQLIYGDASFVDSVLTPERILVGEIFPNPSDAKVTIPFTLVPDPAVISYHVSVDVFNMLGQHIVRLTDKPYLPGFHEIVWDGTHTDGAQVSKGTYVYRFRISYNGEVLEASGRIVRD